MRLFLSLCLLLLGLSAANAQDCNIVDGSFAETPWYTDYSNNECELLSDPVLGFQYIQCNIPPNTFSVTSAWTTVGNASASDWLFRNNIFSLELAGNATASTHFTFNVDTTGCDLSFYTAGHNANTSFSVTVKDSSNNVYLSESGNTYYNCPQDLCQNFRTAYPINNTFNPGTEYIATWESFAQPDTTFVLYDVCLSCSPSPSPSTTASLSPSLSVTPSISNSLPASASASASPSFSATQSPSFSATSSPSFSNSQSSSASASPSTTTSLSSTSSPSLSSTGSPSLSLTPSTSILPSASPLPACVQILIEGEDLDAGAAALDNFAGDITGWINHTNCLARTGAGFVTQYEHCLNGDIVPFAFGPVIGTPAYIVGNGTWYPYVAIGVFSCRIPSSPVCGTGPVENTLIYTRLSMYADWIGQTMRDCHEYDNTLDLDKERRVERIMANFAERQQERKQRMAITKSYIVPEDHPDNPNPPEWVLDGSINTHKQWHTYRPYPNTHNDHTLNYFSQPINNQQNAPWQ